jgi:vitamin B12 transporter
MGPRLTFFPIGFAILSTLLLTTAARAETSADSTLGRTDSAEIPRYRLHPIVVTGERVPLSLDRVPLEITVLDRALLETQRPIVLAEALRQVPEVDVQRAGSLGKVTDVRVRGADPRHTLVLFDGVPLNGPWLGTFDFADLSDPGIERVEIAGGPASSLYGSGAVGGVIQLLPRDSGASAPERMEERVSFEYGELQTLRAGARASGYLGRTALGASVTRLSSEGIGPRDAYRGWNGVLHAEPSIGGSDRARLALLLTDGRKELPYDFIFDPSDPTLSPFGSSKEVRDPNDQEIDKLVAGSGTWERKIGSLLALEGEVSGLYGEIQNDNEANASGGDFQHTHLKNTRGIVSLRARVNPGPAALVFGSELKRDDVDRSDASQFFGFPSRTTVRRGVQARSLYTQGHTEWRSHVLVDVGFRLDDHSRYGAYGLPRVAAGYIWNEAGLKIRAGYGRAFTAPSLSDLYYPGYSADSLRPERSATWEVGTDGSWLGGRVTAQATHHHTKFRDLIQSSSFFVPANIGEARIEGEEYSIRVAPDPRIAFRAGAAQLVAKKLTTSDADPDRRLPKRPAWRFTSSAEIRPVSVLTLTGAWRWVDPVRDPFDFIDAEGRILRGDTPGYASLDLGAIASLRRWAPVELSARLLNALDREYSEVKGFPAPGRTLTVGLLLAP